MPQYRYSVIDEKGQSLIGTMEAENLDVCRRIITQRGLYCIELKPASLTSRSFSFGKPKFKIKELGIFCRQFSTMLSSGISVVKSLDILYSQAEKPKLKAIIKGVYEGVQKGQAFSVALKGQTGAFPDLLINMVEAGEISGTLDKVMDRISDHFEKDLKTANKIKGAMIYPIILGIMTFAVVIVLMVFVLPTFINIFKSSGAPLPLPTQILMDISHSLIGYWYVYIISISAIGVAVMSFLRNEKGRLIWDEYKTKLPIIGKMIVTVITARFSRTLSTLIQSGIPLLKSLEVTSKVIGNKYYEVNLTEVREEIRRGTSLSSAIRKVNVFPVMLLSMISIGEESGTLDGVLHKTATFYDEESDAAITKLVSMLEPLMIVFMSLIVGFIVMSITLPMFGMMQHIH